jgi:hypothetical protein
MASPEPTESRTLLGTGHPNLIIETDYAPEAGTLDASGQRAKAVYVRIETRIPIKDPQALAEMIRLLGVYPNEKVKLKKLLEDLIDSIPDAPVNQPGPTPDSKLRAKKMVGGAVD